MAKSKYYTKVEPHLDLIEAWIRDGANEKMVALKLGVAYSTFREYKKIFPALSARLTRTKEVVDNVEVVNAYLRRAIGYTTVERKKTYKYIPDTSGNMIRVLVEEIEQEKHIPGDPRAMENWLRLRQKDTWGAAAEVLEDNEEGKGIVLIPARTVVDPAPEEAEDE